MAKSLLITGGAGYIGSHACLEALERGYRVTVIDNLSNGSRDAVPDGVDFHEGDLADAAFVARVLETAKPDALIHFAGSIRVEESVAKPGLYYQNNLCNAVQLAELAGARGLKRMVFSSTAAVYAADAPSPISEGAPKGPVSPYGRSKLAAEGVLADICDAHGVGLDVLRYFNVCGADRKRRAGQRGAGATHLFKVAAEVALGLRQTLSVFGTDYDTPDGTCIRDYIHVGDLAAAHFDVLDAEAGEARRTLNVGYGVGHSVTQVINAFERVLGRKLPVQLAGRRQGDQVMTVADNTALRRATRWTPRYDDLDQMVDDMLKWEEIRQAA